VDATTTTRTTSQHTNDRDRDADPLRYDITKHAQAARRHRVILRDKIFRAHELGIDHETIADLADTTISTIEAVIEQALTLRGQSDLVDAS
jgi:hypothetical protein